MPNRVHLDSKGLAAIAKSSPVAKAVVEAAQAVAENVRDMGIRVGDRDGGPREQDLPVKIRASVTDRVRATVVIAHPAGEAVQAKHGALTKAAAQAGLDVRQR